MRVRGVCRETERGKCIRKAKKEERKWMDEGREREGVSIRK